MFPGMCHSGRQQVGSSKQAGRTRSQHLQPEADPAEGDAVQAVPGVREERAYQEG